MQGTDGSTPLRAGRDGLLRDIRGEAANRLWHLDSQVWGRKGAITRCLEATLDELDALIASHRDGGAAPGPGALARLPHSEPQWHAIGLSWGDANTLLDILQLRVHQFLTTDFPHLPPWPVETALFSLKAEIAAREVRVLTGELDRQRDDGVAVQHLAGRFLANASHELRTPLTAVLGFSELLLEETYGEINSEQRLALGHIENSAQNLLEIVNNLLDLMQFRSGKLQLQYRRVAAAPLLRDIYRILLPLANRRKVRFLEELPEDLSTIQADEGIVRHIVYHLLESALRATPENGEVVLRAERGDGRLTIVTHDTALHFPPEAIENMNDAYPILENSPARGYEGWEIGLPLVRRYVDLHGGTLDIESTSAAGTTIRVHLPAQQPHDGASGRRRL